MIKKKDGGSYEPATLQSFQRSLQRYLNDKNSKLNILKDREFLKSREVLLSKKETAGFWRSERKSPSRCKRTIQRRRRFVVSHREIRRWKPWSPPTHSLVVTGTALWIPCPRRKQKLKWGDIVLQTDSGTGKEFLIWKSERGSKTHRGNDDTGPFNSTAQATNNERCPVFYYKEFKSHGPEEMNSVDSPFY